RFARGCDVGPGNRANHQAMLWQQEGESRMTHAELRLLFEMRAAAAAEQRDNALARKQAAIFAGLAATVDNIPHGRLAELGELKRIAPARFASVLGEIGISLTPRHAVEFVAAIANRLQSQSSNSRLYAPKAYREILRR